MTSIAIFTTWNGIIVSSKEEKKEPDKQLQTKAKINLHVIPK